MVVTAYKAHRYTLSSLQNISPSLHIVTRNWLRRYRSRRYTVVAGCIVTVWLSLPVVTPISLRRYSSSLQGDCRYQSSCRYKAVVTPSLQIPPLQGGCRYTPLHVTGYPVTDPRYRRNRPSLQIPSLHRRYRLHCYRGPSLHIVTPYKPCRYTARRYTLYGRRYVSRSCWTTTCMSATRPNLVRNSSGTRPKDSQPGRCRWLLLVKDGPDRILP